MKKFRIAPMIIIGAVILIIDQITKFLVVENMEVGQSIPLLSEFLQLTSHRNAGAAWGMFQGQMFFFYIVTAVVVALLLYIYKKEANEIGRASCRERVSTTMA